MDAHTRLAYQCECAACGAEPGALCVRLTIGVTMPVGRVHDERLADALALHRTRHPAGVLERLAHQEPTPNACARCGQLSAYGLDARRICATCCDTDREPQGVQDRLFTPLPGATPGQLDLHTVESNACN